LLLLLFDELLTVRHVLWMCAQMDTFFQVLEDHTFPTRLSDFFAFAHRSALAAEAECPKVNARTPHYSRAVRKAIAGTLPKT
jgi:hypothetical protein